ncbi:MAG: CRTAC1 family protein [Planctomycetaceae bacterium]
MSRSKRNIGLLIAAMAGAVFGAAWYWTNSSMDSVATHNAPLMLPAIELRSSDQRTSKPLPLTENIAETSRIRFASVAESAGMNFTYYGNPTAKHFMTEVNGGGVSLIDFDADGRLDVFLVNGSDFDHPADQHGASNQLYRATGELTYEAVTKSAELEAYGFGMGSAAADYDNDGFPDVFAGAYGTNRLWRNNGDGTFSETTEESGIGDQRWSSSSAFGDLDGDGNVELYVCNYVQWSPEEPPCYSPHKPNPIHIACGPMDRPGQADILYHNSGTGQFEDVSHAGGIAFNDTSKGLAVEIVDLDEDGRLDIYVANDTTSNHFFRNAGQMKFDDLGLSKGAAVGDDGIPQASMGIACADYDHNGHFDLYLTNFAADVNDFYQNLGPEFGFRLANATLGLDATSRPLLGFGTLGFDFDLDQWPDIFVANGHVWDFTPLGLEHQYEMPAQLFQNLQGKQFADVSQNAGPYFREKWLGRAVAGGDLDNDGDVDMVVTHLTRPVGLLRNDSIRAGGSVRLRLIGTTSSRQAQGARVDVLVSGGQLAAHVLAGGSFQSTSDVRLVISVGQAELIEKCTVHWSNGTIESWKDLPVQSELTLIEGRGTVEPNRQ